MIYSPREKLQILRKQYKISQGELVGDKISRSHLAMIETGKTKLNKHIAQILVENFNKIIEARGIKEKITLDYIIEDENTQITKKRAHYIEVLNKGILNDDLITEIESFVKEADTSSKVVLYNKIGTSYFKQNVYERAFSFFSRTYDEANKIDDIKILENIIQKLSTINCHCDNHSNNLLLEKNKFDLIKDFSDDKVMEIGFNFINSFEVLEEYEKAIDYCELIIKKLKDKNQIFKLDLKKAELFQKKGMFNNSVSIYRGMLLRYKEDDKKLLITLNLMKLYREKGDFKKVETYYKKSLSQLKKEFYYNSNENNLLNSQCIFFELGTTSLYLEKFSYAFEFFKKSLEANIISNNENLEEVFFNLLKLAKKTDYVYIKTIESEFFDNVSDKKIIKIGYLFINYYKENEFFKDMERFLNRILAVV